MGSNEGKKQNIWIPAEAIGNNIDLLTEILLRLQVKPLVRFKCVSKQWLSLISDPQFCVSYNRHHQTPTALLLGESYYPTPLLEMVPLRQDTKPKVPFFNYLNAPSFSILQSCNGLFLYRCKPNNPVRLFGQLISPRYNYCICNPATKQFKLLSFPSPEFKESLVSVGIAFDPLKSIHYKLICVSKEEDKNKYRIDMYSSETDSWSLLRITFTNPYLTDDANPVYCNGRVHWLIEEEVQTSLCFDVDRECLKTIPLPHLAERQVLCFGESRGHLHLIVTECHSPLQFDVLEMAADYSRWFVRYHVNLDAVTIAFPDIILHDEGDRTYFVLHVIRAEKEEDSIVVIHVDAEAISYNVHDGTSKKLCDLDGFANYTWSDTFQYFEFLTFV